MKNILSAAAIALAFAVSVSAQATPPTQSPSPTTDQKASKAHKMDSKGSRSVTLTGCLRQGDTPDSFALENAEVNESGRGGATPGSTATGSSSAAGTGTSTGMSAGMSPSDLGAVKLIASADIDLKEHVGHQVQVSGTMSGMTKDKSSTTSSDTTGSGSSASSSSATGTSGTAKDKGAHTVRVRSLKHISETCSK
jgi:hypothetical protein